LKATSSSKASSSSSSPRKRRHRKASATPAAGDEADAVDDADVDAAKRLPQITIANSTLAKVVRQVGKRDAMFKAYSNAIVIYCRWVYNTFTVRPHEPPTPKFAYHLICRLLQDECFTGEVKFFSSLLYMPNYVYSIEFRRYSYRNL